MDGAGHNHSEQGNPDPERETWHVLSYVGPGCDASSGYLNWRATEGRKVISNHG